MIQINKPITCKKCSQELINYNINQNTKKIVFPCSNCKKTYELTEEDYLRLIENNGQK